MNRVFTPDPDTHEDTNYYEPPTDVGPVHFSWVQYLPGGISRGRLAILIAGSYVTIKPLTRNYPATRAGLKALAQMVDSLGGAMTRGWKLNAARKNRYTVDARYGMSGCIDYSVVVERDREWRDYPRVARFHISMSNKINEDVDMWLGDFAVLLAEAIQDKCRKYDLDVDDHIVWKRVEQREYTWRRFDLDDIPPWLFATEEEWQRVEQAIEAFNADRGEPIHLFDHVEHLQSVAQDVFSDDELEDLRATIGPNGQVAVWEQGEIPLKEVLEL